jgi:hypothetical protein
MRLHQKVNPVGPAAHVPTKSDTSGATGLNGSKKSRFGWKTKKQRTAKREENSAIRIQSVVRGGSGRDMARTERRKQIAIRLQSLRRGVIARDLIKSIKAKETSAVRIQTVARGSIVRNQVRNYNTAATRIQSNHRGHVVRKRQNHDQASDESESFFDKLCVMQTVQTVQTVQQDQASDESESYFDKFFVMSCCTGWGATKSVEADLSETPKTATTEGPLTTEPACDENYPSELSTVPDEEVDSR